jgi:O-acetyl-ADP-ribose deacetylase (regulator of RNase III)
MSTLLGLEVLAQKQIGTTLITAARGSVLHFTGSAIVNAANERCLGGGGVDGAISDAGGDALHEARRALPVLDEKRTRCRTGDAVHTIGGELLNDWCIHAVGPNYNYKDSIEQGDRELESAYVASMREAASEQMPCTFVRIVFISYLYRISTVYIVFIARGGLRADALYVCTLYVVCIRHRLEE